MDKASQVLVQGVPTGLFDSYHALADCGGIPRSTLNYRTGGRRSMEVEAQSQQYLTPSEERANVEFMHRYLYLDNLYASSTYSSLLLVLHVISRRPTD